MSFQERSVAIGFIRGGVAHADFLISEGRIDEADELTKQNLEICQRNNWVNSISRCHRTLGAISRIKKDYQEAEVHLKTSLEIAKRVGMPFLEIEALIEYGRLHLEKKDPESAIDTANQVINLCQRTGFKLYQPDAELILAKAYLKEDLAKAKSFANSAFQKAKSMSYMTNSRTSFTLTSYTPNVQFCNRTSFTL